MDQGNYLNDELKEYYNKSFAEVLDIQSRNASSKFKENWKIPKEIKEILIKINKNKNIATLFSQYPINNQNNSLLKICYRKEVELKLFRNVISKITQKMEIRDSFFYYIYHPGEIRDSIDEDKKNGLGCTDDMNYYNVKYIHLNFKTTYYDSEHNKFWKILEFELRKI